MTRNGQRRRRFWIVLGGAAAALLVVTTMALGGELAKLVASDAASGDEFGFQVSLDVDTAVVGAFSENGATGAAYVFTRSGTTWTEQSKLTASDAQTNDRFSRSVAVDGDTAVVSAYLEDTNGTNAGAVYVFTRSGTTWTEQAKLTPIGAAAGDQFGTFVSLSGDTLVVGGTDDDDAGTSSGSAWVFTRSGATWTEQAKLTASDAQANDNFGNSISVDGDTVVVGAFAEDPSGLSAAGSAYVFTRAGTTWTEQAKLTASDKQANDWFGRQCSVSGDTIVVGSTAEGRFGVGAAYVFTRSGTTWTEQAKLTASDATTGDAFGRFVSVQGDKVAIGAPLADPSGVSNAGTAYVFTRSGTTWTEQKRLVPCDAAASDFVASVSLDGDTVLVGAYQEDPGGLTNAGSAYVFDTTVTPVENEVANVVASDAASGVRFGQRVWLDGDTALAAATNSAPGGIALAGAVYVFTGGGTTWTEQAKLVASDGAFNDQFGYSLALEGDTAVVGAYTADVSGVGTNAGKAYVFTRVGTTWTERATLGASDAAASDIFGAGVALSGNTILVSGWDANSGGGPSSGAAWVFTGSGATWTEQAKLVASDSQALDQFGFEAALDGDTAVVAAITEDPGGVSNAGAVYVFTRSGTTWTQQAKLTASDKQAGDSFGRGVSVSGDTIVVGASHQNRVGPGAAYVFTRTGTTWTEEAKLTASNCAPGDRFGYSVSYDEDRAVIGAIFADPGGLANAGAAYVFTRAGTTWTEQRKLIASDAAAGDTASGVSLDGDTVLVGAEFDDPVATVNAGSAYIYDLNTPPTADAGPDQSPHAGLTVTLDGSGSSDATTATNDLVYAWTLVVPGGSAAVLDDAAAQMPMFVTDIPGTYTATLVVTDLGLLSSAPDSVDVTAGNDAPVADAGTDEFADVGELVVLDGSGSSDPDLDGVTYLWTLTSAPPLSTATLLDDTTSTPSITPDREGEYTVSLVVNDGIEDSTADSLTITATNGSVFAQEQLQAAKDFVRSLPRSQFDRRTDRRRLCRKFRRIIRCIQQGRIVRAVNMLTRCIERVDGCRLRGEPDVDHIHDEDCGDWRRHPELHRPDYITDCPTQETVYDLLIAALAAIE